MTSDEQHTQFRTAAEEVELYELEEGSGEWEVWAWDSDGAMPTATFAGAGARERAEEYALAKYGRFELRAPGRRDPGQHRRSVVQLVQDARRQISPAMVKAGVNAFRRWNPSEEDPEALVIEVYLSMLDVA
jgi:hypothetical protein